MQTINQLDEIRSFIEENKMVLAYFTTNDCNVCKDLYPKIDRMLGEFPKIKSLRGEADVELGIVGAYGVFVVPTIILFVEGKETIRRSRTIGVDEMAAMIDRYYQLVFGDEE